MALPVCLASAGGQLGVCGSSVAIARLTIPDTFTITALSARAEVSDQANT